MGHLVVKERLQSWLTDNDLKNLFSQNCLHFYAIHASVESIKIFKDLLN